MLILHTKGEIGETRREVVVLACFIRKVSQSVNLNILSDWFVCIKE